MPRSQRANFNAFARDFLTFNLQLDHLTGRQSSPDVWPYNSFRRPAVERLLTEFDPAQKGPEEHRARPTRPHRAPRADVPNDHPTAPVEVDLNDPLPEWL